MSAAWDRRQYLRWLDSEPVRVVTSRRVAATRRRRLTAMQAVYEAAVRSRLRGHAGIA